MNWKIKRDPFYSELYEKYGEEFIKEAGFFEDTAAADFNFLDLLDIMCTPIDFLKRNLNWANDNNEKPCVLLFTGSFCPVHRGHLSSMTVASQVTNQLGFKTIGGYISPGHDEYISQKTKEQTIPIHKRISIVAESLTDDWISVDPWEGMFNKVAVNFTDVIVRLEAYLEKHLGQKIPVVFICGGDNARFAKTFVLKGNCVVVNRPGYNQFDKYKEELKDHKNIVFVDANYSDSSTRIRNENLSLYKPEKKKQLFLRYESKSHFNGELATLLEPYYSHVKKEFLSDQVSEFAKMPTNMISMDSLLKAEHNIAISRCYDILGIDTIRDSGYVGRPGYPSIDEQLENIPKGDYYLFDDDIHTGNTMRHVQSQIHIHNKHTNKINIIGQLCLATSNNKSIEILDARDFNVGHTNGGLVMKLPNGTITRAPYIYPYVCPYMRASISNPLQFSIDVWALNMTLFENSSMTLKDLKFKELYNYVGFKDNVAMYDVCKWHYDLLTGLK